MSWAVWIAGVPGNGAPAIAHGAAAVLETRGTRVSVLEPDAIRATMTAAPKATAEACELVHHALVQVARLLTEAGIPVLIAATDDRRAWRELARTMIGAFADVEVARARSADIPDDPADAPDVALDPARTPLDEAIDRVVTLALALDARSAVKAPSPCRAWTLWLTGVPGSGKTTLAHELAGALHARSVDVRVLDVDDIRQWLVRGARPSRAEDDVAHRALVAAAERMAAGGVRVIVDAVGAQRAWRELARARLARFAEVQLLCPLGVSCDRERAVRWSLSPCGRGVRRPPAAEGRGRWPAAEGHGRWPVVERPGQRPATDGPDVVVDYELALNPELTLKTDTVDVESATRELLRLAERLECTFSDRSRGEDPSMLVRDLMTRGLITVSPQTTVTEARALMANERIRHLLVTDGGRLAGIVTDRDIRLNVASPATTLSVWELNYLLARLTVGEVMTRSLIIVDPDRDAREAARIMLDHKIGALPVLEGERLVGILTETDLVRAFAETGQPTGAATR